MPAYQFHRLPEDHDAKPVEHRFFSDAAAIRCAMGPTFPDGCDLWQGLRFVGRFHRASGHPAHLDSTASASQTATVAGLPVTET